MVGELCGKFGIVDVAKMPWFIGVASDIFFTFWVAKDKTILGKKPVNRREIFGICNHFIVFTNLFTVFNDENVHREASVMFRIAGDGKILFTILFAEFRISQPCVPNLLLLIDGAINAV